MYCKKLKSQNYDFRVKNENKRMLSIFGVCKTKSLQIFDLQHRKLKIFECFASAKNLSNFDRLLSVKKLKPCKN